MIEIPPAFEEALARARERPPDNGATPQEADLVVRDLNSGASPFKGVTVTWTHAPATITLNSGALPAPESANPDDQATIARCSRTRRGIPSGSATCYRPG